MLKGYKENMLGHFWELSYDIYDRVEVNINDRMKYTSLMKETPLITKRKKMNFKGYISSIELPVHLLNGVSRVPSTMIRL